MRFDGVYSKTQRAYDTPPYLCTDPGGHPGYDTCETVSCWFGSEDDPEGSGKSIRVKADVKARVQPIKS
jgi:hypothetical protein